MILCQHKVKLGTGHALILEPDAGSCETRFLVDQNPTSSPLAAIARHQPPLKTVVMEFGTSIFKPLMMLETKVRCITTLQSLITLLRPRHRSMEWDHPLL